MGKRFQSTGLKSEKIPIVHSPGSDHISLVDYFCLKNASGGTINVGLGFDVANGKWIAGQYVAVGTTFTDDTTDAQDAGADDFALTTLTNNDGWSMKCSSFAEAFNVVAIDVGVAAAGGAPAYAYAYHNASGWQALTLVDTPDFSGTGMEYLSFFAPADLVLATPAGTGYTEGLWIRNIATTAPTGTAALATSLDVYSFKMARSLANLGIIEYQPGVPFVPSDMYDVLSLGEDVVAYFGTAHASNSYSLVGSDVSGATHAWKAALSR